MMVNTLRNKPDQKESKFSNRSPHLHCSVCQWAKEKATVKCEAYSHYKNKSCGSGATHTIQHWENRKIVSVCCSHLHNARLGLGLMETNHQDFFKKWEEDYHNRQERKRWRKHAEHKLYFVCIDCKWETKDYD